MAAAVAARSFFRSTATSARNATARLSASIFRSPAETSLFRETLISPHRGPFGYIHGRNFSTRRKRKNVDVMSFSQKTRKFRFQRKIDLKRSTAATGIVERIEYDPNRTARIALVRWEGAALQKKSNTAEDFALPAKSLESTTAAASGAFAFSSLPGLVNDRNAALFSNGGEKQSGKSTYVTVGVPASKSRFTSEGVRKKTSANDVMVSAFSTKAKGENAGSSVGFPRIAVAGSRPDFFVLGENEEVGGKDTFSLGEVQKWKKDSAQWMHRIKRKGAVSWHSLMGQEKLGLKGLKPKTGGKAKTGKLGDSRAPVTYILATNRMKKGDLVTNWSAASASSTYSYT